MSAKTRQAKFSRDPAIIASCAYPLNKLFQQAQRYAEKNLAAFPNQAVIFLDLMSRVILRLQEGGSQIFTLALAF